MATLAVQPQTSHAVQKLVLNCPKRWVRQRAACDTSILVEVLMCGSWRPWSPGPIADASDLFALVVDELLPLLEDMLAEQCGV